MLKSKLRLNSNGGCKDWFSIINAVFFSFHDCFLITKLAQFCIHLFAAVSLSRSWPDFIFIFLRLFPYHKVGPFLPLFPWHKIGPIYFFHLFPLFLYQKNGPILFSSFDNTKLAQFCYHFLMSVLLSNSWPNLVSIFWRVFLYHNVGRLLWFCFRCHSFSQFSSRFPSRF